MSEDFSSALEGILLRTDPHPVQLPKSAPTRAEPAAESSVERRRKWFAKFAAERVMPLSNKVADVARTHGSVATCDLREADGRLVAELMLVRGRLPLGARPPRLTIYAADGVQPLMVEFTGTFPHVGALGGFGAEIDYDPVYPSQLEEKVLDVVALASGEGSRSSKPQGQRSVRGVIEPLDILATAQLGARAQERRGACG